MKQGQYTKRKKRTPVWYYALLMILAGVFLYSAWRIGGYWLESKRQTKEFERLAALVEEAGTATVEDRGDSLPETDLPGAGEGTSSQLSEDPAEEDSILPEYAVLYGMNPDLAGWICIEGTGINYPVMHTPDRKEYYLHRGFDGKYSAWGCIFAQEECDPEKPSDNITLYGHNMKDGSMFAGLFGYTDREFWEAHPYIRFDTLTEHREYAVFAVFTTTATKGQGFAYHNFIDALDEADFDAFVDRCRELSFYDTGILPEYGDKLICLSTCEYSQPNGRLVVAAVRVR